MIDILLSIIKFLTEWLKYTFILIGVVIGWIGIVIVIKLPMYLAETNENNLWLLLYFPLVSLIIQIVMMRLRN